MKLIDVIFELEKALYTDSFRLRDKCPSIREVIDKFHARDFEYDTLLEPADATCLFDFIDEVFVQIEYVLDNDDSEKSRIKNFLTMFHGVVDPETYLNMNNPNHDMLAWASYSRLLDLNREIFKEYFNEE